MESKKKGYNAKTKSMESYEIPEDVFTTTFYQDVKKIDTSLMPSNPKVEKMLVCMNEKLEEEIVTLKQENKEIVKKNVELISLNASLEEKIKWYKKNSFGELISSIFIGVSFTAIFTVSDEVFPKIYSVVVFLISSLFCYIFKKD